MLPARIAKQLEAALRGLQYGSVQLVVYDAQVVRIERVERIRLTGTPEALPYPCGEPTTAPEVCQDEHERR